MGSAISGYLDYTYTAVIVIVIVDLVSRFDFDKPPLSNVNHITFQNG